MLSEGFGKVFLASICLQVIVHIFYIFVCIFPDWKHNSWQMSSGLIGRLASFGGIWWECFSPKWGIFVCDNYGKSPIFSKADLQVQRALMIAAVILSLFGLVVGMISLRCSTMIDNDAKSKPIIGIVTGGFFLLAGACVMTATIWFGVELQKQFYNPEYKHASFKYEYGSCLYIGWIISGISLISSLVLIIGSFRDLKREKRDTYVPATSAYHPPSNATTNLTRGKLEYV